MNGSDNYPVAYAYDPQGRMKNLTTYKNYPGTPQVTVWRYDAARGFLVEKEFANGNKTPYTNTADGKVASRVWTRGITTSYSYDNDGELAGVSYSDNAAPSVSFDYNRMGKIVSVTNAAGTRTLSYATGCSMPHKDLPQITETGKSEYSFDALGRKSRRIVELGNNTAYSLFYSSGLSSRLVGLSDGTYSASFAYNPNSIRLYTVNFAEGGTTKMTLTRTYDGFNRMTGTSSQAPSWSGARTVGYDCNRKDQRTKITLAEEMAVGGYFSESHETSEEELPEMEQRVLDDGGIELKMPLTLKSIGGYRNVIVPEGNGMTLKQDVVIRAIRNARKWTDMLVTGRAANLSDLAKKLGLAAPYVTRIIGLVNLAPDIVKAVCSGCEPEGVSLARLVKGFPDDWVEQGNIRFKYTEHSISLQTTFIIHFN